MSENMRSFTLEELAACDGKEGRPAYVAVDGKVVDVSASRLWKLGKHMNRHLAGTDLTKDITHAPHGADLLLRCPQVGVLGSHAPVPSREEAEQELPWLLRKSPFLKRHPHPMTVHFPIAFAFGAFAALAGFLFTGLPVLEATVHGMNLLGALMTPVALLTGLATWKYNYALQPIRPVVIKLVLSPMLWAMFLVTSGWWLTDPRVLYTPGASRVLFTLLVCAYMPVMGVIGWFGAGLTFPMDEH